MSIRLVTLAVVCFQLGPFLGEVNRLVADDTARPAAGAPAVTPRSFEQKALAALEKTGHWEFIEQPLAEVAAVVSDTAGIDVVLDRPALDDHGIPGDVPVTASTQGIRLRSFLNLTLRDLGLTWELRDNAMWITTPEATEERLSVRTYPVTDLVRVCPAPGEWAYDYNSVIDAITSTIAPESWDHVGGPGAIEGIYGALVVSQTRDVQDRIERLLAGLRKAVEQFKRPGESTHPIVVDGDCPANNRIRTALEEPITLEFNDAPLRDVIDFISDASEITLLIDTVALEDLGIDVNGAITIQAKDIPLRSALRRILHEFCLTWNIRDEVLMITTEEQAEKNVSVVLYPVHDLARVTSEPKGEAMSFDFDTLIDVIASCIEPTSWEDVGGQGSIMELSRPPLLAISQTEHIHEQVQALIQRLRQAKRAELESVAAPGAITAPIEAPSCIRVYPLAMGTDGNPRFPADQFIELIRQAIGPSTWDRQPDGFIQAIGSTVVIRHTERVHQKVGHLLMQLTAGGGLGYGQTGPFHGGFGGGGMGGFGGGEAYDGFDGGMAAEPDREGSEDGIGPAGEHPE